MSVSRNMSANLLSQAYLALVGILVLPILLNLLGPEAFGLIAFFNVIQVFFGLLDAGLSGTLSRDTARFRTGEIAPDSLMHLVRILEVLFAGVGTLGFLIIFVFSGWLASEWITAASLPIDVITFNLKIIGAIVALRLLSGLYRSIISGFERQVWLSGFNVLLATVRYLGVIPVLLLFGSSDELYFQFQLIVAVLEFISLMYFSRRLLPRCSISTSRFLNWRPLKKSLKFSLSLSFLTIAWVIFTQVDKLILSSLISLSDYGYFSVATTLAGGILMINGPVGAAITPRLTILNSKMKFVEMVSLYCDTTKIVSSIAFPIAAMLAFFSSEVLWMWTGDYSVVTKSASILALYSIGNVMIVLSSFPFYLQFAKGNLKLNVVGNFAFIIFMLPTIVLLTKQLGMIGAGWAWVSLSVLYFFCWVAFVHRRLIPGVHLNWLMSDVGMPASLSLGVVVVINMFKPENLNRVETAFFLSTSGLITLCITCLSIAAVRTRLARFFKHDIP